MKALFQEGIMKIVVVLFLLILVRVSAYSQPIKKEGYRFTNYRQGVYTIIRNGTWDGEYQERQLLATCEGDCDFRIGQLLQPLIHCFKFDVSGKDTDPEPCVDVFNMSENVIGINVNYKNTKSKSSSRLTIIEDKLPNSVPKK